jgi:hypothetical protein
MKRWTSTWAVLLIAGFLAVPRTGLAQTPPSPAAPAATTQDKADQGTPQEHLQKADAALNSIAPTAVTGKAKAQIADVKKHVNALEKMTATTPAGAAAGKPEATSAAKWATEAAAADKILGELLADAPASGAASAAMPTEPKPTGTSGRSPSASVALDDETKAKLASARASLMAYAAAMSGSASAPAATASPSAQPAAAATAAAPTAEPTAPASPATPPAEPTAPASPATPRTEPTAPASPATPPTEPTAPASPATPPASPATSPAQQPTPPAQPPAEPTPQAQPPASPAPGQPPASAAPAQADPSAAQSKVDADAAKRALTAARDSLSQMTQLPAAQQLTGEARTQVSQLISSFNELITTNAEWKASYAKVDANLTSLIGAQTADESTAAPAAGAAGAVGTTGTTGALDPGIKAKLVEFRTHLREFEKAAGGSQPK